MPQTIEKRLSTPRSDYVPFGNAESRNGLQERLEIPLLVRALRLPCGGRVLEVGCGRGVALPVLAERLRPASLVGVDMDDALVEVARQRIVRSGTRDPRRPASRASGALPRPALPLVGGAPARAGAGCGAVDGAPAGRSGAALEGSGGVLTRSSEVIEVTPA